MADLTLDQLLWEKRVRRYRGKDGDPDSQLAGFLAFCAEQVWINHPQGARLFELRDAQVETARAFVHEDQVLILKARQIGFTTLTMAFCLWRALFWRDQSIFVLSRTQDDAKSNLAMAAFAYDHLPAELLERCTTRSNRAVETMIFRNGSKIECRPSRVDPARGRTATLIVLDEWAFYDNPEDAWASIRPAYDIGGRIIALSTAHGWGNKFHQMWQEATKGDNRFCPIFYPWSAVPERDEHWYAAQQADMEEWQLHQEYPSDPDEAFIKSGNSVFDTAMVKALHVEDPVERGVMRAVDPSQPIGSSWRHAMFDWQTDDRTVKVWERPQLNGVYVVGVDTSEGLAHGDASSLHVIRVDTKPRVVAVAHCRLEPDEWAWHVAALGHWFNDALVGPERNNHGHTVIAALRWMGYPRIFRDHNAPAERLEKVGDTYGWYTSTVSKPLLVDELRMALKDGLVVNDEATQVELLTYARDDKGRTSGSPHDDRVMSLGIANQMRKWVSIARPEPVEERWRWTSTTPPTFNQARDMIVQSEDAKRRTEVRNRWRVPRLRERA